MSHVFHRHTRAQLPMAVRGDGVYLIDADGRRYLDASGGAAVSCLGHSHPAVISAIQEQAARLPFAHTAFFTNEPMEALADLLVEKARAIPGGRLERVYFTSGGSEAMEAAIKMARQYFVEIGQPRRRHLIARRQSYHGNTLGALAAGGNLWRREPFEPILIDATHVSPCYEYRGREDGESTEAYGVRVADELEAAIRTLGPDSVMAFLAEPVVGATAGAVPAVPGYLRRVRDICDAYGVLLILDEVMCGMGRTGTLYACEQDGVAPDLLATAKGLGAGYQPIGALLVADHVYGAFRDGSGFFQHGHTYMGHATACAAGLAVQRAVDREGLLAKVRTHGQALRERLAARFGNHPHVGDIRGRGLFLGLELVADRLSKAPFDPAAKVHARIKAEAMARGLVCYPMGGTIDGRRGDHILLAPPFIIESAQLDDLVDKLAAALDAALAPG
jgi:hypothetical protein